MEMKRRKDLTENSLIFNNNTIRIEMESNQELFFEIRNEVTTDLAEAVAIMAIMEIEGCWDMELNSTFPDKFNVDPEKCLYWLSGGPKEWRALEHYNRPWVDCYMDFQEEFGFMVIDIIKESKTLGDIKHGFAKYLNLPILYDFAISKGFVK